MCMTSWKGFRYICVGDFNFPLYPSKNMGDLDDVLESMQYLEGFLGRNNLIYVKLQEVQFI